MCFSFFSKFSSKLPKFGKKHKFSKMSFTYIPTEIVRGLFNSLRSSIFKLFMVKTIVFNEAMSPL